MSNKRAKIEFAPGCFDGLDITQQELDELVEKIQKLADSGQITQSGAYDLQGNLVDIDLERANLHPRRLH